MTIEHINPTPIFIVAVVILLVMAFICAVFGGEE